MKDDNRIDYDLAFQRKRVIAGEKSYDTLQQHKREGFPLTG
jgi:hypothetical protein